MSSKTLFIPVGGKYYRLLQDTTIPQHALDSVDLFYGTSDNVQIRTDLNHVDVNLKVSNIDPRVPKTNKELYDQMIADLRDNEITTIENLQDKYKMVIDYSLLDPKGEEYGRYQSVDSVKTRDAVLPLGVTQDNECVYRRVKELKNLNEFVFHDEHRFGISHPVNRAFTLQINDISVYEYKDGINDVDHHTITKIPFMDSSTTPNDVLKNMVLLYSTYAAGEIFQPIHLNVVPRGVHIHTNIILGAEIVAYCTDEIDEIIQANLVKKYRPDDVSDPIDVTVTYTTSADKHPMADGDRTPDVNGYYDYYVRCEEDTEGSLHVVEDETPDSIFINELMIHKFKVVNDIPDIKVGEFVKYYKEKRNVL